MTRMCDHIVLQCFKNGKNSAMANCGRSVHKNIKKHLASPAMQEIRKRNNI